jgi:2-dehydro-3-deoxy-D-arabinonate dehydratase
MNTALPSGLCLCRFRDATQRSAWGVVEGDSVIDLAGTGIERLGDAIGSADAVGTVRQAAARSRRAFALSDVALLAPVDAQEIWAAGVTYLRSKTARMEESDFSATAYDRVYDAIRPELFFKSLPEKAVGSGQAVGIRRDARWNVPEPELALVLDARGALVGFTIGNDMSARDIEGENLLYLPQAKIYRHSCALGPWVVLGATEQQARQWTIGVRIVRAGQTVFEGQTSVGQIKRTFGDLAEHLFRCQDFPHGAVLLTGTGVVPPDAFTLAAGDVVTMVVSGIGTLENRVIPV